MQHGQDLTQQMPSTGLWYLSFLAVCHKSVLGVCYITSCPFCWREVLRVCWCSWIKRPLVRILWFFKGKVISHRLRVLFYGHSMHGLLFCVCSDTGIVYKIFAWPSRTPQEPPKSYVTTTYVPFEDSRPIWSMILQVRALVHDRPVSMHTDTCFCACMCSCMYVY